ncbi:MAG: hypothetical protein CL512_05580 [Actinobacteria bacterium]|nr:hypothetical protein [Actinomycetota bacterium]
MLKLIERKNKMNYENIELTEMWQDGKYEEVANAIRDSKEFSEKDRLIDFCLYFAKYLGNRELKVLHKLVA